MQKPKTFLIFILLVCSSIYLTAQVSNVGTKKMVMNINGSTLKIPYYANFPLDSIHNGIAQAVVVIHGTNRNADDYFANMSTAASMRLAETDSLFIIAPQFLREIDIDTHNLDSEHLYWSNGGWKSGSNSKNNPTNPRPERIPSYAVLDSIMLNIALHFPNIESIVFTGHSAGGQVTNRYAASSPMTDILCNQYMLSSKFIVANPSSYLYMDDQRRISGTIDQFEVPTTSCTDYNEWKYGLEDLYTYPSNIGATSIRNTLQSSYVNYILGENDNNPNSSSLDVSCQAMLQGNHRLERGTIYFNYLIDYYSSSIENFHALDTIPGVGHSNFDMYTSNIGLQHLFESYPNVCSQAPLAIELTHFTASPLDTKVEINWQVSAEVHHGYFIIERSKNGVNWYEVLSENNVEHTLSSTNYHAYDYTPYSGLSYYRLRQINLDGSFVYSTIANVYFDEVDFSFYPNPTKGQVRISLSKYMDSYVKVFNSMGKIVGQQQLSRQQSNIDLSNLPNGLYWLSIKFGQEIISKKITLQHY